jgi:16S rRNA (cytosine967-C5)-methyltransferase
MRPASRIQAVIEIYERIAAAKIPMDAIVGDYMRQRRYIGSKDRADIAERTYNVMRAWGRLTWWLERAKAELTPRNLLIAYTALADGVNEDRLKELFDGSKFAPEPLTGDEFAWLERLKGKTLEHPDMPEAVRVECPADYEDGHAAFRDARYARQCFHRAAREGTGFARQGRRCDRRNAVFALGPARTRQGLSL